MDTTFELYDDFGPAKIIHIYQPTLQLKATLIIDNTAAGPSIGGIRMAPDVSSEECFRLARSMTLKNAAAELPHGGGKTVIYADSKMPKDKKEQLIRCLATALHNIHDYIPGPDMGTDEECMAWIKDENKRSVGLPREAGGIPLDKIGATGWGIYHSTEIACQYCNLDLVGARVVIQGFGAVGKHTARYLNNKGALIVGISDSQGAIYQQQGLDIDDLIHIKENGGSIIDYQHGVKAERDKVIDMECDIWIPAARPDIIHADNVNRLHTRLVVQGANIPFTMSAEKILHERGILCIPEFIANAGGVICAAVEYNGGTEQQALDTIMGKIRRNTHSVLDLTQSQKVLPREAAMTLAYSRLKKAATYKRWEIF